MIQVKQTIRFSNGTSGRRKIGAALEQPQTAAGRVPRISKLMALAIRFDGLLRNGVVQDQTELAKLAKVTQPRMTQIMNLLHLAPAIQEELLFLPPVAAGRPTIHEKALRPITSEISWQKQQQIWKSDFEAALLRDGEANLTCTKVIVVNHLGRD